MKYFLTLALFAVVGISLQAQATIEGTVLFKHSEQAVIAAEVEIPDRQMVTQTDSKGFFQFSGAGFSSEETIVVSYVGAAKDTIVWRGTPLRIELEQRSQEIDEVIVQEKKAGTFRPTDPAGAVEVINKEELTKSSCCDLAGCFETQGTVRPQTTNVITNAKNLQMLGLSGVYNQVLVNGLPMIQGLTFTYGVSSYPGPWVENIYVAKGANSVQQGFGGFTGQINMETSKPSEVDRLFLNAYGNSFGEAQVNLSTRLKLAEDSDWSSWLGIHTTQPAQEIDRDDDNFMDVTRVERYSVWNQWQYSSEENLGWSALLSGRWVRENRIGGQLGYEPDQHALGQSLYGQNIFYNQGDLSAKVNYKWSGAHALSLDISGSFHDQHSQYGLIDYNAQQKNIDMRLMHNWSYSGTSSLHWGVAHRSRVVDEILTITNDPLNRSFGGQYLTELNTTGLLVEHQWNSTNDKWKWILGGRYDHDPALGGFFTTRTQIKYEMRPSQIFRLSAGNGWRQVLLFSENTQLLAGNRKIQFEEPLEPEQAWNTGANYTYTFASESVSGYIAADYYFTYFQRQFFPDYDQQPATAIISNFDGTAHAHSAQIEGKLEWGTNWEAKASYNFAQVRRHGEEGDRLLPFIPRHRMMAALSYRPGDRWYFDMNMHYYGTQRLPTTEDYPEQFQTLEQSPSFEMFQFQATHKWKQWEIYAGVENLLDFRQKQPILSWEEPFGQYFDPSFIWGPTRGREWYLGLRYRLP
jgi:outer membrane cobalamin receptor